MSLEWRDYIRKPSSHSVFTLNLSPAHLFIPKTEYLTPLLCPSQYAAFCYTTSGRFGDCLLSPKTRIAGSVYRPTR